MLVSSRFHLFLPCDNIPQCLSCPFLLEFAFGFQVFTKWRLLECSWTPFDFAMRNVAKLLCSCLCLFDAIVKLHAMHEKMFNGYLNGVSVDFICNEVFVIHDLTFYICIGDIYHIKLKSLV